MWAPAVFRNTEAVSGLPRSSCRPEEEGGADRDSQDSSGDRTEQRDTGAVWGGNVTGPVRGTGYGKDEAEEGFESMKWIWPSNQEVLYVLWPGFGMGWEETKNSLETSAVSKVPLTSK